MKITSATILITLSLASSPIAFADHTSGFATDSSGKKILTSDGCLVFGGASADVCESDAGKMKKAPMAAVKEKAPMPKPVVAPAPKRIEPIKAMAPLKPMEKAPVVKSVINLKGVTFKSSSDELNQSSYDRLNTSAQDLINNPGIKVIVAGHTDNRGDSGFNQQLSKKRAESVRNYLINKGVNGSRLSARGYGDSEPAASNDTREGRAQNRRVELRIIE